jgi:hypothetical protein
MKNKHYIMYKIQNFYKHFIEHVILRLISYIGTNEQK